MRIPALTTLLLVLAAICTSLKYSFAYPQNVPSSPNAVVTQARVALREGKARTAISMLEGFVKAHPKDFQARMVLGMAFEMASQPHRAEQEFKEARHLRPNDSGAILALGSLYNQMGESKKAIPLLEKAAASGEGQTAYFELSVAAARLHRFGSAAKALHHVHLPESPKEQIMYRRLEASIDAGRGNVKAAAKDMEQALQLAPNDANLIVSTAVVEEQAKNPQRAAKLLQPLFSRHPDPMVGLWLLRAQLALKQNTDATLRTLKDFHLSTHEELPWHLELAKTLADGGLHRQAVQQFEAAAHIAPRNTSVLYDLALEQYRSRQPNAALATVKRAVAIKDSAEMEDLKGDIEESLGDSLAAAHSYQKAVALAPKDERYRLSLGYELLKHHSFEPARIVFQQAAGLFPNSVRMRVALGMTDFFLQRYHKATQALIQAVKLEHKSDFALNYLGTTQLDQPVGVSSGAVTAVCQRADSNPQDRLAATYCGALMLRKASKTNDESQSKEIVRRLREAVRLSPKSPIANCELGRSLQWAGQWSEARSQMEACVRLEPDSSQYHYRLGQIDEHLGLRKLAQQQFRLQEVANQKMNESIARHKASVKQFLYDLRRTSSPQPGSGTSGPGQISGARKGSAHSRSLEP